MTRRAAATFPASEGKLTDDAANAFLATLTSGKVTGIIWGPTTICSPSFPT